MRRLFPAASGAAEVPRPRRPRDPIAVPSRDVRDGRPTPALEHALRNWIGEVLASRRYEESLADRVALRLGTAPSRQRRWHDLTEAYSGALVSVPTDELLRVVNTILDTSHQPNLLPLDNLEEILDHGGSPFTVERRGWEARLVRRVDSTVRAATDKAVSDANAEASKHLADAWGHAFGFAPDPDKAYACAVKAVEAVAIPIMCPKAPNPTLGNVLTTLRGQSTTVAPTWQLGLPNQQDAPASVAALELMVELLWHGQRSRHAGSTTTRSNTLDEAQTAVRLAVLLVSWFTSGAVQKTSP